MDDRSVGSVAYRSPRGPNPYRRADPERVSFLDPRPDSECIYADANQVCWNKAKLRRAEADYANDNVVDN
jgi:hypothetical protein